MRKFALFTIFVVALFMIACNRHSSTVKDTARYMSTFDQLAGDSTLYGLACDGCTDSVLIFLPYSGGDPDTFNIIEAMRNHQIYGSMRVGDKIAIQRNSEDSTVADKVINISRLLGTWCYLVEPKLKNIVGITEEMKQEMLAKIPDSVKKKMMMPLEYGFMLKGDNTARPVGTMFTNDRRSPVEFPHPKFYVEWHVFNGDLILCQGFLDSVGHIKVTKYDTTQLVTLRRDTMVLRLNGKEQGYYRKP